MSKKLQAEWGKDDILQFLDQGEEPEIIQEDSYQTQIVPEIEAKTGFEHPENVTVKVYDSGMQLLHDLFKKHPSELEKLENEFPDARTLKKRLQLTAGTLKGKIDPYDLESNGLMLVSSNLRRQAEILDVNYELSKIETEIHDRIHLSQGNTVPSIMEEVGNPMSEKSYIVANAVTEGHADFYSNEILAELYGTEIITDEVLTDKRKQRMEFIATLHDIGGTELTRRALEEPPRYSEIGPEPEPWLSRVKPAVYDKR